MLTINPRGRCDQVSARIFLENLVKWGHFFFLLTHFRANSLFIWTYCFPQQKWGTTIICLITGTPTSFPSFYEIRSLRMQTKFIKNVKNYKRKKIIHGFCREVDSVREPKIEQFPNACIFEKLNTVQIVSTQIHRTVLQHPKSNIN